MSSEQAIAAIAQQAPNVLPPGFAFEWTDLSFQQVSEGGANLIVFPLAILLVFLVPATLYESWVMPLAILMIVPLCILAALLGVHLAGGDAFSCSGVGFAVAAGYVGPWLKEMFTKARKGSKWGGGKLGIWVFCALAYGALYYAYLVIERRGPGGLLPASLR